MLFSNKKCLLLRNFLNNIIPISILPDHKILFQTTTDAKVIKF